MKKRKVLKKKNFLSDFSKLSGGIVEEDEREREFGGKSEKEMR